MHVHQALSRLEEIHTQLLKGELYRGFRSVPVAASGLLGLAAALAEPLILRDAEGLPAAAYWICVAALSACVGGGHLVYEHLFLQDLASRWRTRRVALQLLPALAAGALATAGILLSRPQDACILPGLWAMIFGLGVFSARPYLPRAIGWVALFYLLAGGALLCSAREGIFLGWTVGATFGLGQLGGALVLYWNLERVEHGSTAY